MKRNLRAGCIWIAIILAASSLCGCASGGSTRAPASATAISPDISGRYVNGIFPDVEVARDIKYAAKDNESGVTEDLLLDLYQPKGDTLAQRPAVIFVHGGGFTSGDKAAGIELQLAERLAHKGYVTLSINYRLRKDPSANWVGAFADASSDAYSALEWLVAHKDEYRIDIGHIAFGGHSAGSNIVSELCYSSWSGRQIPKSSIFAVIAMAGPQMIQGDPEADDPFCVIIHGEMDELVPFSLSENLTKTFDKTGTRYVFYPMPGMYHNLTPAINEVEDVVTQNLYRELTGQDAGIRVRKYADERNQILAKRLAERPTIEPKRINAAIDGKLDEWTGIEPIPLTGLKDAGAALPAPEDFTAQGRIAWDRGTPRICVAVTVTDDIFQESGSPNMWENDSVEVLLDLYDGSNSYPTLQWIFNVNGKDVYCSGNAGSSVSAVVRGGHSVTYELAVDIGKVLPELTGYDLSGRTVGVSLTCNDCENGVRQHQLGLVAGETWNPMNFANLRFIDE